MRTIGILIAIAAACGGAKPPGETPATPANEQAAAPAKANFDQSFIDAMVAHHRVLIGVAQVAKERATRPEVQAFADSLARTAQGEADRMLEWRRTWYGSADVPDLANVKEPDGVMACDPRAGWGDVEKASAVPAAPVKTGKGAKGEAKPGATPSTPVAQMPTGDPKDWTNEQRLQALRAANVDVDKAFLAILVPMTDHGVELAKTAQTRAERAELREFARALRDTQERTLTQARQWNEAWYPGEAPARMHAPAPEPATPPAPAR